MTIMNVNGMKQLEEMMGKGKVILDFYADWCGPCKLLKTQLEQLDNELGDELVILKIDVDENPDIAREYNLMSIPALFFVESGNVYNKISGFRPKNEILKLYDKLD